MAGVPAVHESARFSLITGDPRHASWKVGYTIRVLQTLETGALCAFHPEFPRDYIFDGDPRAEHLTFAGPKALREALDCMDQRRYRELVILQREAAALCRQRATEEDPLARLLAGDRTTQSKNNVREQE